jgi:predicted SAM-dependent methyltransferase
VCDVVADLTLSLPFRSSTFDYIHSEDFIEHVDLEGGQRVLQECYRVLKRGGVMRLLTPDLRRLIRRVYLGRSPADLRWCRVYLDASTPCEALNMHLRMDGEHRFVYDEEFLRELLTGIGFTTYRTRFNSSRHPALRYLDLRNFGLNLFLECEKP